MNGEPQALEALIARLGYTFKNTSHIEEALTHKSYYYENTSSCSSHNERLEFLGDAVLSLIVASHLFSLLPPMTESRMSKVKSYVVKGTVVSDVAVELSLAPHLRLGRGEESTGGRAKRSVLANAMEAVIGAVYMDGGLEPARELVMRLFGGRIVEAVSSGEYHDYKTELQELCQMKYGEPPEYRLVGQEGMEHDRTFTIEAVIGQRGMGRGRGGSKKAAEQEAARVALEALRA